MQLSGPLSIQTVPDFLKRVRAETAPALILDFAGVTVMDSAGVGALLQTYASFTKAERRLALAAVPARPLAVLEITRVQKIFQIFPTAAEAEAGL